MMFEKILSILSRLVLLVVITIGTIGLIIGDYIPILVVHFVISMPITIILLGIIFGLSRKNLFLLLCSLLVLLEFVSVIIGF